MTYCISLAAVTPGKCEEVGGKACSLSIIIGRGLRVPRGIVVTASAYDDFVQITGLAVPVTVPSSRTIGKAVVRIQERAR